MLCNLDAAYGVRKNGPGGRLQITLKMHRGRQAMGFRAGC